MVPITINTSLKTEAITLLVRENPYALVCNHQMGETMEGFLSTRIKMGKTSDVIVVVKSGGKLYSASRNIKVTIGGCGG
jgi:sulfur-oxidizing protein SoxY